MKIAILGSGAIGLASAAILAARGHAPVVWSPSGAGTAGWPADPEVTASGALAGRWRIDAATDIAAALDGAGAVLLAVDAGGHVPVMQAAAPHLTPGVPFIIGAAHSLGAVYLSQLLAARGAVLPIVSWNTTLATAHKTGPLAVDIRTVRPRIEAAVMPSRSADEALALCRALAGATIEPRPDALAIAFLSNANPVFHVPVCLLNLARIEHGETWAPYAETTPAIGRLMEALDAERIAVAAAYGATIHSVNEHFHRSFRIPLGPMAEMNATLHASGRGPKGPRSIDHRYLAQDISYGLVFAAEAGRRAGLAMPVHDAAITLATAATGRDYRALNTLLPRLDLDALTPDALLLRAREGCFDPSAPVSAP